MRKRVFIITVWLILVLAAQKSFGREVLKLATTTSTYETGLLDYILPHFEKEHNVKVHVISVGTGKAIKLGENGDVDIILVHDRESEDKFMDEGYGVDRRDVMYNDFVILGPKNDPAKIAGLRDVKSALKKIYDSKYTFVSRGDESGTDKKEKYLWEKAGIKPDGTWYMEAGQGMGATLRIADEKNAYILVDRATYLFNETNIRLIILVENNADLLNPYGVIAVNPRKHPHVKYKLAVTLIQWLISPECQKMINEYTVNGKQLFFADAGG